MSCADRRAVLAPRRSAPCTDGRTAEGRPADPHDPTGRVARRSASSWPLDTLFIARRLTRGKDLRRVGLLDDLRDHFGLVPPRPMRGGLDKLQVRTPEQPGQMACELGVEVAVRRTEHE